MPLGRALRRKRERELKKGVEREMKHGASTTAAHFAAGKSSSAAVAAASDGGKRMDALLQVGWAGAAKPKACSKGCSFCCSIHVSVTIPEVIRMVEHANSNLGGEAVAKIRERARVNAVQTHGKSSLYYPARLDCAMLVNGECLAYSARPIACRREHSLSVEDCKNGYEMAEPGVDYALERDEELFAVSGMPWIRYTAGLAEAGVDARPYELQEALDLMLSEPNAADRWLAGEPIFDRALSNESLEGAFVPLRRAPSKEGRT